MAQLTAGCQVVDDFSSKLDLPSALETVETIDADHSQMIKFADREDAGYRAVSGTLRKFIRAYFQEDNSTPEVIAAAATAVPVVPPEIPDTSHDEPDTPQASEPPPAGAQKVEEAITLLKRKFTCIRDTMLVSQRGRLAHAATTQAAPPHSDSPMTDA